MSKAIYPLKLPSSIRDAATRLAKQDGVSLNQWITMAVAQKVGAVETAEEFLKQRAGGADGSGLESLLKLVRNQPPIPGDELPEGFAEETSRDTQSSRSKL